MYRFRLLLLITLMGSVAACDGKPTPDGQAAQDQKDSEGLVWRGLLQALGNAPTDDAKVRLLEKFIAENPDHPDIADAKQRLQKLTVDPRQAAFDAVVAKAFDDGDPRSFAALSAASMVLRGISRIQVDEISLSVELPGENGPVTAKKSLRLTPSNVRLGVNQTMKAHSREELPQRCSRACMNEAVSKVVAGQLGSNLYADDGKLDPNAVGPLLEKIWVDPDDEVLGNPAKNWFALYEPTIRAYAAVGDAVAEAGPAAVQAFSALQSPAERRDFYTKFAEENGVAEKTKLEPRKARAIAGWWLRRHVDGTAPLFAAHGTKVLQAYGPPADAPDAPPSP